MKPFKKVAYLLMLIIISFAFQLPEDAWLDDYNTAAAQAIGKNKPILMVFTGSDWCRNCLALEKEVFTQTAFHDYAAQNLVLLKVDFPRGKKNQLSKDKTEANGKLAEKYNNQGVFPYLVLLSPDGTVIKSSGYLKGGLQAYLDFFEKNIRKEQQ